MLPSKIPSAWPALYQEPGQLQILGTADVGCMPASIDLCSAQLHRMAAVFPIADHEHAHISHPLQECTSWLSKRSAVWKDAFMLSDDEKRALTPVHYSKLEDWLATRLLKMTISS
jgi:hypothetical protein